MHITATFEMIQQGILITDTTGVIQYVNSAFTAASGYAPDEAIGQTPRLLQSGWHVTEFYETMWDALLTDGHWQGEIWNRRKDGEIHPQFLSINAIRDDQEATQQYAAVLSDLSKSKHHENELHYLSYHDPLTGLPNRLLFIDRLTQAIADAERSGLKVAVLFVSLDRFKLINDKLGHSIGDTLLQNVSGRLLECLPDHSTLARLGKDEFALIMESIHHAAPLEADRRADFD